MSDLRYKLAIAQLSELKDAAQKVVDETNRSHDSEPWPVKYRAPYGAITELSAVLARLNGAR